MDLSEYSLEIETLLNFTSTHWKALFFTSTTIYCTYKILKLVNRLNKYQEILHGLPENTKMPATKLFGPFKFAELDYKKAVNTNKVRYNMYEAMSTGARLPNGDKLPGAPLSGMSLMKMAPWVPPMIAIGSAEASQVIFKNKCILQGGPTTGITSYIFGNTVFTTNGSVWKEKRTRLNMCFGMQLLEGYLDPINHQSKRMVDFLLEKGEQFEINFRGSAFAFSADVSGDVLFGQDFQAQNLYYNENKHPKWQDSVEFVMNEVFAGLVLNPLVWDTRNFKWIWPRLWWKFCKTTKYIRSFLKEMCEKRKVILKEMEENIGKNQDKHKRVIDKMLESFDKGEISEEDMISELYTVIVGGYDTSSNTFSDGLAYLAEHQDVQEKLYQEIIEHFPAENSATYVDFSHLNKMPYLSNVVREMIRLCGPVPASIRKITKPIKFTEEYTLQASEDYPVTAFMPVFVINQDEKVWGSNAKEFVPERHDTPSDDKAALIGKGYGNGFAHGSRDCVGKTLAVPTMKSQMVYLLKNFKVSFKEGEKSVYEREKTSNIMIRFEDEPVLVFEKR